MTNIDEYSIETAVYLAMASGGIFFWILGFCACCILIATSPIGALLCRTWARRQGLEASRYAWLGALYWACGFMPWVHFAFQINGRMQSRRLMWAAYTASFFAWLAGPVFAGFAGFRIFNELVPGFMMWIPIANLLAFIAALVCLVFADELPETRERVQIRLVIPSLLWSLAMLTCLPYIRLLW